MTEPHKPRTINEKELSTLRYWEENDIFEATVDTPAGGAPKGQFSFYDGPPFATGMPHHGHILAGTIKDAIPRYQTMRGNSVRRVWGWDCHGLPIENLIEKKLGLQSKKDIEEFGIGRFNKDAFDSVLQYEAEWKKVIPRLGRFVDMDLPYKTMDSTYTESIWWAWKTLYEKGLAYEGHKMMHICPRCETPLAQSEVGLEYHDVTDLSVTAKFKLKNAQGFPENTFVLAWTTTPWTLPGNTALAIGKDVSYVLIKKGEENYILAEKLISNYFPDFDFSDMSSWENVIHKQLVGIEYEPLFDYYKNSDLENKENIWKIWEADFITDEDGTGIAHEAPAFGADDMELAKANSIPVIKHVKMDGTFTEDVTDFAGMKVKAKDDTQSADIEIVKWLAHNGKLFEKHKIVHSYPLCWRCKTPLLNYATSSWFVDVPKMKDKLLLENAKIGWTPEHIRNGRFGKWLEGAREWAVSRSRYWGAPLPIWKSEDGDIKVIGSLKELAELSTKKPKNTYYVVRHGEAKSNISRIIDSYGDVNNVLTESGKEQSRHIGHFAKEHGVDIIIHSPLLRSKETANIANEYCRASEMTTDDRLKEFDTGIYSGKSLDEFHMLQKHGEVDLMTKIQGGESYHDIMNRTMALLHECEEKYEGKTILFVTHGAPVWMMEAGAHLRTDEELRSDMHTKGDTSPANGHVIPLRPLLVPRDETGAVNLHRPYIDDIELEIGGTVYKRIADVFDCWFESGSMPFAQLHYPFENKEVFAKNYPADFIAEGLDQTRGWFYSLINLGVGLFDRAPYKHVIVNGLVLAESGLKLSKSEKNYTDPMELVERYGADSVRYFLLSSPVVKGENVQFSDKGVEDVYKKVIQRLENVVTLYEMNLEEDEKTVPHSTSKQVLDHWIVTRMREVVVRATKGYDTYALDEATYPIDQFVDDLSVWYVRRSRDRLKGDTGTDDRRACYETLTYILITLSKVIAPVMPFLAERVYKSAGGEQDSVHLESWPVVPDPDMGIIEEMRRVREMVTSALALRTESKIAVRQPLQKVTLKESVPPDYRQIVMDELNVKELAFDGTLEKPCQLDLTLTGDLLAEGDVRNLMRAIQDVRKEKGLTPRDTMVLVSSFTIPEAFKKDLMNTCKVSSIEEGAGPYRVALSGGEASFDIR